MYSQSKMERFNENVLSRYQVYNSVFLTLPFDLINNTGVLLPLFSALCESGFKDGLTPKQIVDAFLEKYLDGADEQKCIDIMFRFIQYVERQIVLFDAIEDAAFPLINNLEGHGSLPDMRENAEAAEKVTQLRTILNDFATRVVLTAHPTQFYPGAVLGIIGDLTDAIRGNDLSNIRELLSQLGKTPFIKKEKPTPFDEAVSLIWYLENVFYEVAGEISSYIRKNIYGGKTSDDPVLQFGFWPGGDRDGNPFVTTDISLKVADRLRNSILKCYYNDIRILKRKLTFPGVDTLVADIENKIYRSVFYSEGALLISLSEFTAQIEAIKSIVVGQHQSLYLDDIDSLLDKVRIFGFHFATLDFRQNSAVHDQVIKNLAESRADIFPANYLEMPDEERIQAAASLKAGLATEDFSDIVKTTLESVFAMRDIQQRNGELGCNRYIISNCESAVQIMETYALFGLCGWQDPSVDIVPLFEIISDLANAAMIMSQLYSDPTYSKHLKQRGNRQTVMLGFSDGTKDGGYLMANWSIFKAKEAITAVSREFGVEVIFFDGRGGPPARGGGKTHKFYASLGPTIENKEIQLTVQGQTISSNFGTFDSCRFNLENLLSAGVSNHLADVGKSTLSTSDVAVLEELASIAYDAYSNFKNHPKFVPYLEKKSTLKYYSRTNIGSRPAKRNAGDGLVFADLRAIPFVGSWSQLKQNVPGFFGVGTALKHFEAAGRWKEVHQLYDTSLLFRTLLENSMMSLAKSFFPLTAYMKDDPEFGDFWQIIYNEFLESKRLLLKIAGHNELMENYPDGKASIDIREKIVLPLLTIQQYALQRINALEGQEHRNENLIETYEKIVTRSLFGNTNASRNSA